MIIFIIENVYLFFRIFVFPMFVFFPRKCIKGDENCNPKLIRTVMKKIVIMIFLLDKNRILIFSFFVFVFSFQRFFYYYYSPSFIFHGLGRYFPSPRIYGGSLSAIHQKIMMARLSQFSSSDRRPKDIHFHRLDKGIA